jgi:phosphoserine phosphatase RsbU/P
LNPSACRRSLSASRILSAAVCLGVLCSAPVPKAQTTPQPDSATAAQPFDASSLPGPVGLGAKGAVWGGDDPAFARPGFDDSKWIPIDEKTQLGAVFPDNRPEFVWQRIHVKVNPAQTGMGLESFGVSQAYEVYVNGQKLIESGHVDPFVRYTEDARIVVSIPDEMVKTGSLIIAVRARVLPRWWKSAGASFPPDMISLGQEEALHDHAWSKIVGSQALEWLLDCCGIVVCLVALALFSAQRRQYEYLWLSLLGATSFIDMPINAVAPFHSIPAALSLTVSVTNYVSALFLILMVMAFVRQKLNTWLLASLVALTFVFIAAGQAAQIGTISIMFEQGIQIPFVITVAVLIPIVLLIHLRRGNREAGLLLIPMIFWSLATYAYVTVFLLEQIPALHGGATKALQRLNSFSLGPFALGLGNVTAVLFFLTMAVIIVRRSTRMSRQQAVLEGEMAAAREVQQVLLPEQVEPVPGFTVESAYEPAQQVGGDFFQVLTDGDGGLLVVVGDVAGKGLPAAMLVSVMVGAIRGVAEFTKEPAALLANFNERLVGRGGFSTALVARISASGSVTIANAGHLSPYLDGREVELPGALPLGVMSGVIYETTQFNLVPGSRLTFYSDGVVEAQDQKGELFGFDRAKAISTEPAAAIVEAAKQFGQSDDITVVTIEREMPVAAVA